MHFSLLRLLKRAHYNPQADILVPTGDMLTKGGVDGSLEVLEFLRTQNKKNGNSVRAVRGNQDQPVVEWRGWIEWIEQLDEHGRPVPVDRTQATGQQTQTQTQTQMPEPGPEPTLATSLLDLDHAFFRVLFRYLPDNLNRLLGYYLEHHYVSPSGRSMRRDPHTNSKTGTGTSAATTQHHLKKDLTGAQWLAALDAYHKAHPPLSSEPRAIRHFLKRLRHANPSRFWKLLPPHLTKHGNLNLVEDSWNEHMETTEDSLYGTFVECNTRDRNEDEDNDKGKNTKVSMLDPNTNTESASTLDKNANHDIAEPDLSLTLFSEPYLIARRMSSADFAWLRDIPTALHLPDLHAFVVHAGLVPYDPTKPRRAVGQPLAFVPALSEDQKHERSHGVHIRAESGEDALDFVEPAPPPLVKGLRHKHQKPPTRAMPAVPPVGAEDHSNQDVSGTDPDQPHRLVVESTQMRTMKSTKTTTNLLRLAQERLLLSSHASGPKHDQHIGIPQNLSPWTHMNLRSVRRNGGLSGKAREGRYWAKVWNGEMGRCGGYPGYSKAFGHGTSGLGGLKGLGTFAEELGGLDGLVDREKEEEDASRGESSMEGDEDEEDIEDEKEDEKTDDEGNGEHTDGKKKNRKKKRRNMPCIPSTVIYGHTASFGLDLRRWTKGLDSGCVSHFYTLMGVCVERC
jgi:hypothetical protein